MAILFQRIEGLLIFISSLFLFYYLDSPLPWWLALLIFFLPDLSFIAYSMGARIGAYVYNATHIYALGAIIGTVGLISGQDYAAWIGLLLIAHCGFDRALGYGLKHASGFKHTHLGTLRKR